MGRTDESESVEFQLGGTHLVAGGIAVVALCAAAFLLGRWWERAQRPEVAAPAGFFEEVEEFSDPVDAAAASPADGTEEEVGESLTFFENLSSGSDAPASTSSGPSTRKPVAAGDRFVVQVLATQDQASARSLAGRLEAQEFPVGIVEGRDGAGNQVFRVRVGPFRNRGLAEETAARLRTEEKLSTWVRIPE